MATDVCMCVCMYVCMYRLACSGMHVTNMPPHLGCTKRKCIVCCIHAHVRILRVCVHVHAHVHVHMHVHVHAHACMTLRSHANVNMHTCMRMCMQKWLRHTTTQPFVTSHFVTPFPLGHSALMKRALAWPAARVPDDAPWCKKSRTLSISQALNIPEVEAAAMMTEGNKDSEANAAEAQRHSSRLATARQCIREAIAKAERRRADAAAAKGAAEVAALVEQSACMSSSCRAQARLAAAAAAAVVAEGAAVEAAAAVRRSMQQQRLAAAAADAANSKHRQALEHSQREAAALQAGILKENALALQGQLEVWENAYGLRGYYDPAENDLDRFFVKLYGPGQTGPHMMCFLDMSSFNTIAELKAKIQDKEGISSKLKIIFRGQQLADDRPLLSYGITDSDFQVYAITDLEESVVPPKGSC